MSKKEISLLPEKGKPQDVINKFIDWVLSVGKYIIVFTQLIVIGAFLSRFWLDRINNDLSAKIRQQSAILSSAQNFERQFRLFQSRLIAIDENLDKEKTPIDPLLIIGKNLPPDIYLLNYNYNDRDDQVSVNLQARVFTEIGLAEFIDGLINEEDISSVQIGDIEKKPGEGGMAISFQIKFN